MDMIGFPGGLVIKNPPANAGDTRDAGSIPGSRRSPGVGNSNPLQCSCLENSMDRGTCQDTVHGITRVGHDLATTPPPPFFFRFFPTIGYYKTVNIVPCAIK